MKSSGMLDGGQSHTQTVLGYKNGRELHTKMIGTEDPWELSEHHEPRPSRIVALLCTQTRGK